jgi:hypothetical protein
VPAKKISAELGSAALAAWLTGDCSEDERATAVRYSLQLLAAAAPGKSVEVRVPPYAAVQCLPGSDHRRGTPSNVVETDAETWLALAAGRLEWQRAVQSGRLIASGSQAGELATRLPLTL